MRRLLQWMGTSDDAINKVALDVMRENEGVQVQERTAPPSMSQYCTIIESARKLQDWADYCALEPGGMDKNLVKIFEYMRDRDPYIDDTDYYWTSN